MSKKGRRSLGLHGGGGISPCPTRETEGQSAVFTSRPFPAEDGLLLLPLFPSGQGLPLHGTDRIGPGACL